MLKSNANDEHNAAIKRRNNIFNRVKLLTLSFCITCPAAFAVTPPDASNTATQPTATSPKSILTMKSGFSLANTSAITISPKCPLNFVPYVTISGNQIGAADTVLAGRKACVSSVTVNASDYTANIIVNSQTFSVTATNDDRYVIEHPGSWDAWYNVAVDMPANDLISTSTTDSPSGFIYWVLYCYPPGTPPFTYTCT